MSLREELTADELRGELRGALAKLDKERHRTDQLVAAVERAVATNIRTLSLAPVSTLPSRDRRRQGAEVAVAVMSDWQLAKLTPTYNSEVCEKRVNQYVDKVIELTEIQRKDHPVKECHVWLLGDLVEGELIFPGQEHRIDGGLYRQVTIDGPRILANALRKLLAAFETVHVIGVIGNHGKVGGSTYKAHDPETNADRMLYRVVQQILEAAGEKRITWDIPDGRGERYWYAVDDIGGYRTLLFHGDQIRGGGFAGFPFYGLAKRAWGWATIAEMPPFKDLCFGHYHQIVRITLNDMEARCNGTTESTNTWAHEELSSGGRPAQWLLFVYPGRGVTAEYSVYLD